MAPLQHVNFEFTSQDTPLHNNLAELAFPYLADISKDVFSRILLQYMLTNTPYILILTFIPGRVLHACIFVLCIFYVLVV